MHFGYFRRKYCYSTNTSFTKVICTYYQPRQSFCLFFELLLAIHVALFYFVHDAFFSKVAMPDSREAQKRQLDLTVAQGTLPTRIQLRSMVIICQVTQVVTNSEQSNGISQNSALDEDSHNMILAMLPTINSVI